MESLITSLLFLSRHGGPSERGIAVVPLVVSLSTTSHPFGHVDILNTQLILPWDQQLLKRPNG